MRSACPGVRVYAYEETPPYLKTLFALEGERKYPPDSEHWDGVYRILKAPYYFIDGKRPEMWLLPTPGQQPLLADEGVLMDIQPRRVDE